LISSLKNTAFCWCDADALKKREAQKAGAQKGICTPWRWFDTTITKYGRVSTRVLTLSFFCACAPYNIMKGGFFYPRLRGDFQG
jgi:hypothetical protein